MRLIDTDKIKFPNIAVFDMKLHGVTVPMVRLIDLQMLMPTVDAVPLDKLCELCEEVGARVPCVICSKIMPEWCKKNNNFPLSWDEEYKCPSWKAMLTKWMEEQDAEVH